MLTDGERERLDSLEQAQFLRSLTIDEREELAGLAERVTTPNDHGLLAANERMRHERAALDSDREELERLLARKERLARRLGRLLALYRAERMAIDRQAAMIGGRDNAGPRYRG